MSVYGTLVGPGLSYGMTAVSLSERDHGGAAFLPDPTQCPIVIL